MNHELEEAINKSTSRRAKMNLYKINFTCIEHNVFIDYTAYIICNGNINKARKFIETHYSNVEYLVYHKIDSIKVVHNKETALIRIQQNFLIPMSAL